MLTSRDAAFRQRLLVVDALLALAIVTSTWFALVAIGGAEAGMTSGGAMLALVVALAAGWFAAAAMLRLYDRRQPWSIGRDGMALAIAAILAVIGGLALGVALGAPRDILLAIIGMPPLLAAAGMIARIGIRAYHESGRGARAPRHVLVVGTGPLAGEFVTRIRERWWLGLEVFGFLGGSSANGGLPDGPVLGTVDDLTRILHERVVDDVAVCLESGDPAIERAVAVARDEGKTIHMPIEVGPLDAAEAKVVDLGGLALVSVVSGPNQSLAMLVKRCVDVVGAIAGLVLLSPVLIAAAVAILLTDGRPILFTQPRAGLNGRPFRIVKFRTMTRNADADRDALRARNEISGGASFKVHDDPRVTRAGRILRKTSIDELPQLWNVLRGEMSLVGPRPHPFDDVAGYATWHRRRLSVKPGITGLWQVKGRLDPTFDQWVKLDLEYIDEWSLWLDLRLILQTVPALLRAEGR